MNTRLFLVRHGKTGIIDEEQLPDDPLAKLGITQITRLGNQLKTIGSFDLIYTSKYRRAIDSAAILAKMLQGHVLEDNRINEIGLSTSPTQLHELGKSPMQYNEALKNLLHARQHGFDFIRYIVQHHQEESIIIVAHGNIIRAVVAEAIAAGVETAVRMRVDHASLTILEYDTNDTKPFFRLTLFNDTSHLV